MSRSKSPEIIPDKKPRIKNTVLNTSYLNQLSGPLHYSNSENKSKKNRLLNLSNVRSSKFLKPKRSLKSIKTPLNKSPNNSIIHTTKDDIYDKILNPLTLRTENTKKIEEILRKIQNISEIPALKIETAQESSAEKEKLDLFIKMFEEIIEKDKQFSKYLLLIKTHIISYYEDKVSALSANLGALKKENELILSNSAKEKHSIQRTIETLSKENHQLSKDLDNCEEHIIKLQKQLELIHSFNSEVMSNDVNNWKCLVLENKFYTELCQNLKKEIEVLKYNQEMILSKFDELKAQGVEISYEFSDCFSSYSASLNSVQEVDTVLAKKKSIPNLNILNLVGSSHLL